MLLDVKHLVFKTFISFRQRLKYFCWRARFGPLDNTMLSGHLCERDMGMAIIVPHLYVFLCAQNGV